MKVKNINTISILLCLSVLFISSIIPIKKNEEIDLPRNRGYKNNANSNVNSQIASELKLKNIFEQEIKAESKQDTIEIVNKTFGSSIEENYRVSGITTIGEKSIVLLERLADRKFIPIKINETLENCKITVISSKSVEFQCEDQSKTQLELKNPI